MNLLRLCNRIIKPTRLYSNRQLQQLSVAQQTSPSSSSTSFSVGQEIHGYIVKEITPVPEFRLTAIKLQHKLTGCQHLHVDREHKNNVWSVAFQTTPKDNTGVAHILEHTTLCGSEKFPCRDPFFKMTNRSMATFMNAFTASDWTMYVFSTQNQKDYHNLMSVYLDAVLHPKLDEYDFMQEGWRLEHEKPDDPKTPIVIKGVVFNEMKGVFSDSHQVYARRIQNSLMPTTTYQYESGGDPIAIPKLTWNGLKQFHATHYHPSNARFFTYGSFPLTNTLEFLNNYLKEYKKPLSTSSSALMEEAHWNKSQTVQITCSPQSFVVDPDKTTTVSVSYLLGSVRDTWETFLLNIVCSLLVDSEKSPFYKKLIIPNIGSNYSPDTGFGRNTLNTTFHVGLQDISKTDVDRVIKMIDETFEEVAKQGFEQTQIDALLHQFELGIKHQDENFGLKVILGLISSWIHNVDPIDSLQITKYLERFNNEIKQNPRLLQDMIEKYFLKNNHKLIATMNIDEEYAEKKKQNESQLCQQLISQCQNKQLIYQKGLELQKRQSAPQNVDVLPTLSNNDIDKKVIRVPIIQGQTANTYVQLCEQPTNGITYFRCLLNSFELPNQLKPYLPLFVNILTKIGSKKFNYLELSEQIALKTGGLNVSTHIDESSFKIKEYEEGILLSSYCLDRNIDEMFNLWEDVLLHFNEQLNQYDRLKTLIKGQASAYANSVHESGHTFAVTHSASQYGPVDQMSESLFGLTQVNRMQEIARTENFDDITNKLKQIADYILTKSSLRCAFNGESNGLTNGMSRLEKFLTQLPGSPTQGIQPIRHENAELILKNDFQLQQTKLLSKTHFEMPFDVFYAGQCYQSVPYSHEDYPRLLILTKLMFNKFLLREIREIGGAYGGGAYLRGNLFSFFSYRDPHSIETIERFGQCIEYFANGNFTDKDVDEAKLATFQKLDKPKSPGSQGMTRFLHGIDDDMRQTNRDRIFACRKQDLIDVTQKYLVNKPYATTILGPDNPKLATNTQFRQVKSVQMPSVNEQH